MALKNSKEGLKQVVEKVQATLEKTKRNNLKTILSLLGGMNQLLKFVRNPCKKDRKTKNSP